MGTLKRGKAIAEKEYVAKARTQLLNRFVPDILCPIHNMPMLVELFEHDRKAVVYCGQCGEEVTVQLDRAED